MKFEKLNENKIKITFSIHDLEEKNINFHDFMSNSLETQDLFLDILAEAEDRIGFKVQNCNIKIETLAMTNDNFILTVTKVLPSSNKRTSGIPIKIKPKVKRKSTPSDSLHLIYKFISFDDYCNFIDFLISNNLSDSYKVAEKIVFYSYKNNYYLDLFNLNTKYTKIDKFNVGITEFGSYILNPDLYICKLNELGTIFLKNNALKKSLTNFLQKSM